MSDPLVIHQPMIPPRCRIMIELPLVAKGGKAIFLLLSLKLMKVDIRLEHSTPALFGIKGYRMLKVKQNSRK